jgi:23S rRNA A2030 N6-methylase RlmJ
VAALAKQRQRRSAIRNAPAAPAFRGAGAKEFPILWLDFRLCPEREAGKLTGCGMVVVNPP